MLPGPTVIRECPHCKSPFKEWTLASGNTMRAKWWTDGNMNAPMLPMRNALVTCPTCCKPIWIDASRKLGQVDRSRFDRVAGKLIKNSTYDGNEDDVEFCKSPTPVHYLEALESQNLSTDEERYIRFRLWWLWNDVRRDSGVATPLTDQEVQNLESLMLLLDGAKQNDILAKAEALRELGRFNECIALIDTPVVRTERDGYAANILYWAEQADPYVRELQELPWDFVRSGWERLKKKRPPFEIDPSGPPVFKVNSDSWWVKVLGMLQHNWALVEETDEGAIVVYFAHDEGIHKGPSPYKYKQLKNRVAIVDSLEFDCWVDAWAALRNNGFEHADEAGENIYLSSPEGVLWDARATEPGVYSKQGYWKVSK